MKTFESKYGLGDFVRPVTGPDDVWIITGVNFRGSGVQYDATCGTANTHFYDMEIEPADAPKRKVEGFGK